MGIVLGGLAVLALVVGTLTFGKPGGAGASASPAASAAATEAATATASPSPSPTDTPLPTPSATPILVPAPLTGMLVSPEAAARHPIAVMVDDHLGARPQSGFNAAAIVFQAPAEGGIPRYMLVFQDQIPTAVGPIRSARQYYIEWAAEWNPMYVHFGGSFQALDTLRATGHSLVWNADGLRWAQDGFMWRVHFRVAPHNVYTDGTRLEALAARIGANPETTPLPPAFGFAPDASAVLPTGNAITVTYPYESITFRFDPTRNAYLRYINGSKAPQVDAADNQVVAPTNVVVLRMHFGPLLPNDPHHRLEASDVGHGDAYISTGGMTIHGTWRKASITAPIQLFDGSGKPVSLQPGQTFVEVIALNYSYKVVQGKLPPTPSSSPAPSGSPMPSATPSPS
jgi:hypothetical protein